MYKLISKGAMTLCVLSLLIVTVFSMEIQKEDNDDIGFNLDAENLINDEPEYKVKSPG
jgi:hypothetical protein